jgi:beta-phosphoglucomutase-like phosphatase (HAD superfamily)
MEKLIIYDFDGTLADTLGLHLEAYKFVLSRFGISDNDDNIIAKCFNKLHVDAAANYGISDVPTFGAYYSEGVITAFRKIKLYPQVIETLST